MQKKKAEPVVKPIPTVPALFPWDFKIKCYILLALGLMFYGNSLLNHYALDDSIAIERNDYVQKGISGIGKILTTDSYDSFYRQMGASSRSQYSGGRYRPLSLVSFAIEQSLFGDSPFIRHLVNVLMYLLCIFTIFYFLNNYLLKSIPGGSDMAFLATALFTIHPIHTEVVANIKSLDEIMSLTLIMSTFIFSLKYVADKKIKNLAIALVCYFLSLLAKEYAITLIALLPLLFYLIAHKKPVEAILTSLPFCGIVIVYLLMRFNAVGIPHGSSLPANDPLVDPFLYATHSQKIATEWWALGRYIIFLFFPYPLSCDYSYAEIPYHVFSQPSVWLSMLVYVAIIIWTVIEFLKKSVVAFVLLFFLACISLISNFLIELGAILGERLLFHASLAFTVLLSYYLLKWLKNVPIETKRIGMIIGFSLLAVICIIEVIPRNAQWNDDDTLFIHDVTVSKNSALLNNDAGWCYLGKSESKENTIPQAQAYLDSAKKYLYKALTINKSYMASFVNLATVYFHFSMPDSAKIYIDKVRQIYPNHPSLGKVSNLVGQLYLGKAMTLGGQQKPYEAIKELVKGVDVDPNNPSMWYNLGGAYYTVGKWDSARYAWSTTLQLQPDYNDAKRGLQAIENRQAK
jgi:tetratricopeptide (TPR) repeat protein